MKPFLLSVAENIAASPLAPHTLVILPTRRSIKYLRRYLRWKLQNKAQLPALLTIADLGEHLSGLKRGDSLELLFALYQAWRKMNGGTPAEDFHDFRRWGQIIIRDYNDVDMYCVDPAEIFKNVSDLKQITTGYLSQEQIEVLEDYFGLDATRALKEVEGFCSNYEKAQDDENGVKSKFKTIWERLIDLYHAFDAVLTEKKIGYAGYILRHAVEAVENRTQTARDTLGQYDSICFVGFNALSTVERKLFGAMQKLKRADGSPLTDFFWDVPGPALAPDADIDAGRFLRTNAKKYPCSDPDLQTRAEALPMPEHIEITGCPGPTAQAKLAAELAKRILKDEKDAQGNPIRPEHVAIVLPDENMLFPLYDSLDGEAIPEVNITMGYPLAMTAAASFVRLLVTLQMRARGPKFVTEDIRALLSHPISLVMLDKAGEEQCVQPLLRRLESKGQFSMTLDLLLTPAKKERKPEFMPNERQKEILTKIFKPLESKTSTIDGAETALKYLSDILETACNAVATSDRTRQEKEKEILEQMEEDGEVIDPNEVLPADFGAQEERLRQYLDQFDLFARSCRENNIAMSPCDALRQGCDLLRTQTVHLQGIPMRGLQIMGMLETRALDFDYLIIPSMNEGIFPRRNGASSYIPDTLRRGYGIATTRFQEQIFAYHFFRLIARARRVHLLYDTTQGSTRGGDPSRYLLQLQHLLPGAPRYSTARTGAPAPSLEEITIDKNDEIVQEKLHAFLTEGAGARMLSPSTYKNYLDCQLKFFLGKVLQRRPVKEPDQFVDNAQQGSILHGAMQEIYSNSDLPEYTGAVPLTHPDIHPRQVTREYIDSYLNPKKDTHPTIEEIVLDKIKKVLYNGDREEIKGSASLIEKGVTRDVKRILERDRQIAPFQILACELRISARTPISADPDAPTVGFEGYIDRLDLVEGHLRIVDYKTGKDETAFGKVKELFDGNGNNNPAHRYHGMLQLFLYAHLLPMAKGIKCQNPDIPIALSIYHVPDIDKETGAIYLQGPYGPVENHTSYMGGILERLRTDLTHIFGEPTGNPGSDQDSFKQSPDLKNPYHSGCAWCDFASLCGFSGE